MKRDYNYQNYIEKLTDEIIWNNEIIFLKINRSYTCINRKKGVRYSVGKGKEGKYFTYRDKFLSGKNIVAYYVVENEEDFKTIKEDPSKLNFINVPNEEEYKIAIQKEKENREKYLLNAEVESWKRILDRKKECSKIFGYHKQNSTLYDTKDIIVQLKNEEGESSLYMSTRNVYEEIELEKLIKNYI